MQAFLLIGDTLSQEEHLQLFIEKHKVPEYLCIRFSESFKIADVRNLSKTISVKLHANETRLVVINDPTLDAQNAILKTLEELPERTYVFFLSRVSDAFLPTILSRVLTVHVNRSERKVEPRLVNYFVKSSNAPISYSTMYEALELLPTPLTIEDMEVCIVSARSALLTLLNDGKSCETLLPVVKKLLSNYSLCKTNNIHKVMSLENII